MGNRVHVVKRQCEYGNTEAFNYQAEEFANFLSTCGVEVSCNNEYDYSQFEVDVDEYRKALRVVKHIATGTNLKVKQIKKYLEKNDIDYDDFFEALDNMEYNSNEMYEIMNSFYEERDKKSGWMQFHSW